jgi:hypothetical protein
MKYKTTDGEIQAVKTVATQIRAALEALTVAEQTMRVAGERLEQLGLSLYADFVALTGTDDAALDAYAIKAARLEVLKRFVSAATSVRDSVFNLQRALGAAKEIIATVGQWRSADEGSLVQCFWVETLRRFPDLDLPHQVQTVRSVGRQVVRDLEQLLSRRVGMALSAEEIREGFLRVAGLGTVRALTQQERLSGYAIE